MNYLIIENDTPENNSKIQQINQHIRNNKPVVIYFYKDGCPFCERTTPEWDKLSNYLSKDNDLLVVRINKLLYDKLQYIGDKPMLYPNIRYVRGSHIDTFKKEGDERNSKNLAIWIQQQPKINSIQQPIHSMKQPIYSMKQPIHSMKQPIHSMRRPIHSMRRPIYKFLKKPKYKKSLKKKKYNKFSKKRRQYYM